MGWWPDAGPDTQIVAVLHPYEDARVIRLRLLGETAIDVAGTPLGPESQVLFGVLLVLSLERGKRIARTSLHRLLWPGADDDTGRHNLRQVLYKLRQLGAPLDTTQSSVMLAPAAVTGELVELITGGAAVTARLASGRRLGELLPGYAPAFSSPFADWVDEQRGLLQSQLRRALLAALDDSRAAGRWRDVEALAREVLRSDPLNEEATLAMAEATALAGGKAQAIGIIDRYLDEVGRRPGDLQLPATVLRRRIAERFPAHKYVSAADACFVGRASEMAALLRTWQRARDRRGGAVLLHGEPGIGKSRLALELGKVAILQGAQLHRVASRAWDVHRPLSAIVDIVPALRDTPGALGVDPSCHEYLDRLTRHDATRAPAEITDAAALHRQVRQAVFDLIDALLSEAPLVLVFEDVQWLDAASWEMLAELLRMARSRRLLLVLTSRTAHPPQLPESEDWESLQRLGLTGIDAEATGELLDAMTREAGKWIDPEYREWCVPLANGNPLHVQEIALQWLERGSVREAPASLRAMVGARIARLGTHAQRSLQVLALCTHGASASLLRAVLADPFDRLLDALDELCAHGLVIGAHSELRIRHPLIADTALQKLSRPSAVLIHSALAKYFETAPATHTSARWECYRHWRSAGDTLAATRVLHGCVQHLLSLGQPAEAIARLRAALTESTDDVDRHVLASELVTALASEGRWAHAIEVLGQHSRQATPYHIEEAKLLLRSLEARWRISEDVAALHEEAVSLAASKALPPSLRGDAALWALVFADNLCERGASLRVRDAINDIEESDLLPRHQALDLRTIWLTQAGRLTEAAATARDLAALPTTDADFGDAQRYSRHAALALFYAGMTSESEAILLETLGRAESASAIGQRLLCVTNLARQAFYLEDVARATQWIEYATALQSEFDLPPQNDVVYLQLQLALLNSDSDLASTYVFKLGPYSTRDVNRRRVIARMAGTLGALLLDASSSQTSVRDCLTDCHSLLARLQNVGALDNLVAAVVRAHWRLEQGGDGAEVLRNYLSTQRLERCPLHLELRRSAELLSPWKWLAEGVT